jgi:hypothetical protein
MARCFVIQPFDKGKFDKRYDEVFIPAIEAVDLEPYRVDRDPHASILIDQVQKEIRASEVCLAEITLDNPNVWYELGYAIACEKEVVLVCSAARATPFPFDVRHRQIIEYTSDSPGDFQLLEKTIVKHLRAALEKEHQVTQFAENPVAPTEGLQSHEIAALATIMKEELQPEEPPSAHQIRDGMQKAGFTELAAALAVKGLLQKGFVTMVQAETYRGDPFTGYAVTELGTQWLLSNQSRLVLRTPERKPAVVTGDDDLPF